jgi:hypothetical protein
MKAKLIFDLDNLDDKMAFDRAVYSTEMALFIWELRHNILRKALKEGFTTEQTIELIIKEMNELSFDIDNFIR